MKTQIIVQKIMCVSFHSMMYNQNSNSMNTGHEEELWRAYDDVMERAGRMQEQIEKAFKIVLISIAVAAVLGGVSYLIYLYANWLITIYHTNNELFGEHVTVLTGCAIGSVIASAITLLKKRG